MLPYEAHWHRLLVLKIHTFHTKLGIFISISESEIIEFKNGECNQKGKIMACGGKAAPFTGDIYLLIHSFSFSKFSKSKLNQVLPNSFLEGIFYLNVFSRRERLMI